MVPAWWIARLLGQKDPRTPPPFTAGHWMRLWTLQFLTYALISLISAALVCFLFPALWPVDTSVLFWVWFFVVNAAFNTGMYVWHARRGKGFRPIQQEGYTPGLTIRHRDTGETVLELPGDSLAGAHLSGADLRKVNFWQADLRGAELQGADLREAHLGYADLQRANLQGARLEGTLFHGADIGGTDFRGATLGSDGLQHAYYDATTQWPEGFSPKWRGCVRAPNSPDLMPIPASAPAPAVEALPMPAAAPALMAEDRPIPAAHRDGTDRL